MTGQKGVSIVPKSTCDETLKGTDDLSLNKVVIFPNPTSHHWSVYLTDELDKIASYRLVSIDGQLVQSNTNSKAEYTLDLNGDILPHGIYILDILTENGNRFTSRLVKRP